MDDCFGPGLIVTQHGPKEMVYNKMQACAQKVAGYDNWQPYWPFLVCTEANYGDPFDSNVVETTTKCAEEEGSYYQDKMPELYACFEGSDGDEALVVRRLDGLDFRLLLNLSEMRNLFFALAIVHCASSSPHLQLLSLLIK